MMMTMDQPCSGKKIRTIKTLFPSFCLCLGFGDFGSYSSSDPFTSNQSTSSPISTDSDVDWSVFENAGMSTIKKFIRFCIIFLVFFRTIFIT